MAPKRARAAAPVSASHSKKRKAVEDTAPPPATKRVRTAAPASLKKGPAINEAPTQTVDAYVCGENSTGELGLGTAKNTKPVKRPRLNNLLDKNTVGVVQLICGGMHAIALTKDNKILTWGVNDNGALGRETKWNGGFKDMDAMEEDSDDENSDNNGLNPFEAAPGEVDWSSTPLAEGTRFTCVAAGDSCSFAVTEDGKVYGWGTFRDGTGVFGFTEKGDTAYRPILIKGLKDVTTVVCGSNHAIALTKNGATFSWGCGEQNQLGRRVIERKSGETLKPRPFGLPKGPKNGIASIHSGSDHSFAIAKTGDVYVWGLNNFAQTGLPEGFETDYASLAVPRLVPDLISKQVVDISGGNHFSVAVTKNGECYTWGRNDSDQLGLEASEIAKLQGKNFRWAPNGNLRVAMKPQRVTGIDGEVVRLAASGEHCLAVTNEGEVFSWGFSEGYQTGQGEIDGTVPEATLIDNSAVRGKKLVRAETGGQFSILMSF